MASECVICFVVNGGGFQRRRAGPEGGETAERVVAADGAGITAFCGMKSLRPAPLLNVVVRPQEPAVAKESAMLPQSRVEVFREILSRPTRGIITVDEAAGVLVYAIDDPSEVDELLLLASDDIREAIRRFVQQAPCTEAEWEAKPFFVLDGDECDVRRYRSRVRGAVEALRERLR